MEAQSVGEASEAVDGLTSTRLMATPTQCRAARAMLHWTQRRLANKAGVARKTVADFEANRRLPKRRTRIDISAALRLAGIEFMGEEGVHCCTPSAKSRATPIAVPSARSEPRSMPTD